MHSLRDILALLDRAERRRFRWLLLLIGAMGATTLTGVCSVIPLAALLADPRALERHPWAAPLLRAAGLTDRHGLLFIAAAACLLLVLLANLVNWLGAIALGRYAHRLGTRFGVALFAGYLARNVSFHRATSSALLLSNVIWEVPRGVTQLLQAWFTLLSQAVAAGLIVISVLLIQPAAALAAGTLLAVCYALFYLAGRARLQRNGHVESWAVAARTDVASQAFGGIREVTVLGAQPAFIRRFAAASEAMAGAACDTQALALVPRHLLEAALGISLVGAGLWLARDGRDTGAWLVPMSFLGIAAYRLLPALQQIFHSAVRIRSDRVAFARIAGDLRRALRPLPACAAAPATAAAPAGLRTLELRGVSFRYGTERAWILHALDLQITAGQMLGVIGTSGSGKSTLAELLLGLLKPTHGQVLVDGVPLADLELAAWHARVAYVPQEVFLFDSSIAYNVSLAEPGDLDPVRLAAALRDAQLSAWIESLPRGTDEPVGERGVRLSGGQRQRLGIARALYRRPALLLLDEITSALDPANEAGIVGMLAALKGRCTLVLIAHRRSALRHCDRLLDLDALREARAVELAPP